MVNDNGKDRRPAAFAILAERRAFAIDSPHIANIARKGVCDPRSLSAPEILQLCKTVNAQIGKLKQHSASRDRDRRGEAQEDP